MASPRPLLASRLSFAAPAVSLALLAGCGTGGQTGDEATGPIQELRGTAQRLTASGQLPNSASADGWAFGFDLYAEQADPAANTFFSPYSISTASSMLFAGAAGQTKTEMASALSFTGDGEAFHQARNTVALALESRNRPASDTANAQTLRVVNDIWLDPAFRPTTTFLDTLSAYYGASAYLASFASDPEAARVAINDKVATDTEQLILDLLPPNSVNDAAFVLTNAIYFKSRWPIPFPAELTADAPFEVQSGASVTVPMMRSELTIEYVATDDYVAVALPYDQDQLELLAIMPTAGTFASFVAGPLASVASGVLEELQPARVDLRFPKLEIEAEVPLKQRLQELGMVAAFDEGAADFSALSDTPVFISDAFHKATIAIDEEGTVAAAATAYVGIPVSEPPAPVPVTFDHPFVFLIRDVQTNALLFLGHYAQP